MGEVEEGDENVPSLKNRRKSSRMIRTGRGRRVKLFFVELFELKMKIGGGKNAEAYGKEGG